MQAGLEKYDKVMHEADVVHVKQRGVSYIQMQKILVQLHAGLAPLPIGEFIDSSYAVADNHRQQAADKINSYARGRIQRKKAKKIKMQKSFGKLKVKVSGATDLRPMTLDGSANAQVIMTHGDHQQCSTERVLRSLEPSWGEAFYLDRNPDALLKLEVLHSVSDDDYSFMGAVSVDTSKLKLDEPLISMLELADPESVLPTPLCGREMVLRVYQARGLRVMDSGCFGKGASDPFVRITHGNCTAESSVQRATLTPQWNEVLLLEWDPTANQVLTVDAIDWDLLGDNDHLG